MVRDCDNDAWSIKIGIIHHYLQWLVNHNDKIDKFEKFKNSWRISLRFFFCVQYYFNKRVI